MMSIRIKRLAAVVLLVSVLFLPSLCRAADPFYENLLRIGEIALDAGQLDDAVLDLELACFGLLEEPQLLARGLSLLAIAQSRSGETTGLQETLERLLQVEERLQGYSLADLEPDTRLTIEQVLLDTVALERLRSIEAFRPVAHQRDLQVLMAARPAQRRQILQQRLENDPQDFQALQLLADLEVSEGAPAAALPYLDALVNLSGGDPTTICRRFRAAAGSGNCPVLMQDLPSCSGDAVEPDIAPVALECLLDAPDLEQASQLVEVLPAQVRSTSKVRKLERRLSKEVEAAGRLAAQQQDRPVGDGGASNPGLEETPTSSSVSDPVSSQQPLDPCSAFRSAALDGRCDEATMGWASCPEAAADTNVARAVANCYVATSRWLEAQVFLNSLPASVRSKSKVRKVEKRVDAQVEAMARAAAAPTEDEEAIADSGEAPPAASEAPSLAPTDPCAAFRTALATSSCEQVFVDLPACIELAAEPDLALGVTRCYVDAQRWSEARTFLDDLPPQVAGLPKLRKLGKKTDKALERAERDANLAAAAALTTQTRAAQAGPTDPASQDLGPQPEPSGDQASPAAGTMAPEAGLQSEIASLRRGLDSARSAAQLNEVLAATMRLANEHPDSSAVQFLAAEAAYRGAQWELVVRLFDAGGDPGEEQPLLLFYKAVALFETGDTSSAATYLKRALPHLQRTAFVDSYASRILAAAPNP